MHTTVTTLLTLASLAPFVAAGDGSHPIIAAPVTVVAQPGLFAVTGDLNGDGQLDLLTSGGLGQPNLSALGDGAGQFTLVDLIPGGLWQVRPLLADITGDGVLDLLLGLGSGQTVQSFEGLGDGGFGPSSGVFSIAGSTQLAVTDVDDDGDQDLLIAAWSPGDAEHDAIHHLINDGSGAFEDDVLVGLENPLRGFEVRDLNGDGLHDLVMYESFPAGRLLVRLGQGGTSYGAATVVHFWSQPAPVSLHVVDVTGDGDLDLLMFNPSAALAQIFENPGDGDFELVSPQAVALPDALSSLVAADLDGDGAVELVVASQSTSQTWVLGGNGFGTWTRVLDGVGALDVRAVADVDADGRADLVLHRPNLPAGVQLARNLSYPAGSPFTNLALGGLAGSAQGTPVLVAGGAPVDGQLFTLSTSKAPAATPNWFVLGASKVALPFKGGLLVPSPTLLVGPIPADGAGAASVGGLWPAGLSGLGFWAQAWLQDASGPVGFTATPTTHVLVP